MIGLDREEAEVSAFLSRARDEHETAEALLAAVAAAFELDRATLDAKVREFRHCNCDHD